MARPALVRTFPFFRPRSALLAIVLIGLAVRVAASLGSPWLDELWSWRMAMAGDVLAAHDNNHLLNTLWLWLVGDYRSPLMWRLPAILAGGVTIVLAWTLLKRLGRVHAAMGAMFVAVAYPLVVYQSEARGYALMLACLLACIELQLRLFSSNATVERRLRLSMAICAGVGVMSHLSLAIAYPLLVLAAIVVRPAERSAMDVLRDHAMAIILIATWIFTFGLRMGIGGGPEIGIMQVLSETAAAMTGAEGAYAIVLLPVLVLLSLLLTRRREPRVIGMLGVLALLYPLLVLVAKDRLLYVRYFLPAMLPAMLLIAAGVGEALRRPRLRHATAILAIALASLQGMMTFDLITRGRDSHGIALRDIAQAYSPSLATVGSDAEFQLRTIAFYHDETPLAVVPSKSQPDWFIVMHETPAHEAETAIGPARYDRHALYRAPGLSGITWTVYKRRDIRPAIDSAHADLK